MGNYIVVFRCSKILREAGKQEIFNKCSENSRCQIVFRIDIFRKLSLGAPDSMLHFYSSVRELTVSKLDQSVKATNGLPLQNA